MPTRDQSALDAHGRQIHLIPLAPGLWAVILGCGVMVLGPLFGFLVGSMLGANMVVWGTSPIFLFLFFGFLIAAVGLGIVLLGARRMLRDRKGPRSAQG